MLTRIKNFLLFLFLLPFILCSEPVSEHLFYGIPSDSDVLLNKKGYSLGYSQKYKQAIWVSYILEAENLQKKQVPRRNKFRADPAIKKMRSNLLITAAPDMTGDISPPLQI